MKVYFIGAGPGDPELITVKGQRILGEAGVVIYAGSLVNPEVLQYAPGDAEIHNSASMTLEEVIEVMAAGIAKGLTVVRLHTGDPSIYGAIQEQIEVLEAKGIPYEVVPGVSSFVAAAAALKREFTVPEKSQTVIITRLEGRTKVPPQEKLSLLAQHQSSLCIFLSVGMIERVVEELLLGYTPDTPIAVVEKASWKEEKIIRGSLRDIALKVKEADIQKTALILVGEFLESEGNRSQLYHPDFVHEFRG